MHTHHLLRSSLAVLALLLPFTATHAADVPRTLDELWAGYAQLDRETPLEAEVLKEWEKDGIVCRIVRYQVGVFKGAPSRVAGLYA
ncbi:MAG: hypothetical protein ACK5TH_20885, partial [Prosthecobacter sp.]